MPTLKMRDDIKNAWGKMMIQLPQNFKKHP